MNCEDCIHEKVCEGYSNCEEVGLCEPKRPHGKWKACEDTSYCKCSRCSTVVMLEETYIFHFCPWCGALMSANDEQVTGKLDENTQKHYGFRKKY